MLWNYISIAFRNLYKNKSFSSLNIIGLAIGMAAYLFIVQYVRYEHSYEDANPNADNVYRITLDLYNGNEYVVTDCEMYAPVGPMLKDKMPEVVDFVRMMHNDGLQDVEANNKKFLEEGIYFADPSVFTIFSVDVLKGNKAKALTAPNQIVLSESAALKYFESTDKAIGQSVKIRTQTFHVTAVMADQPLNTHLKFQILLSHSTLNKMYSNWYNDESFNGNNEYTYLLMKPGTDIKQFQAKLDDFAISLKEKIGNERFGAEKIRDIHLHSTKSFEPEPVGSARTVNFLLLIAAFIIIIAWVNYVNLSTARAIERAREVGIRKTMGSARSQLIFQFLAESLMINVIAGCLAFIFFQTGLPFFTGITGAPLSLDLIGDRIFWYVFLGLMMVGSLLSGLYPAFVLSSFKPALVLKGKLKNSSHGQALRKGLVVFQFAAAVVLMIGICVVYLQIRFLRNQDLGMELDQTLVIRKPFMEEPDSIVRSKFTSLTTELRRQSHVQAVASSESLPGLSLHEISTTSNVKRVGQEGDGGSYNYYYSSMDANLIPTLEMELVAGTNFESGLSNRGNVIINEEAVTRLGFRNVQDAVGGKITFPTHDNKFSTIVGVLKNFYHQSPKEQQIPMIFYYDELGGYYAVKVKSSSMATAISDVKKTWTKIFPNSMFHYFFLDEKYDQQYQAENRFGFVTGIFSLLAVIIACLGLFGLSAFTIVQRTKEIGIRKVLGATVLQIVHLLTFDFIKVVCVAAIVGVPIAYFAVEQWLSAYAVRIDLNIWVFAVPVIVILIIATITVSYQTFNTAFHNPTSSLKQE